MNQDERDHVQNQLRDAAVAAHGFTPWAGTSLPRQSDADVYVRPWLAEALERLNLELPERACVDAIAALERAAAAANRDNLVEIAKTLLTFMRGGVQVSVGRRRRTVQVIDFDEPTNNRWDIATEVTYRGSAGTRAVRFDIVVYCNGIPLVVVETKSNTNPDVSWLNAAKDLANGYTNRAPAFLAAGLVQIATDGREVRYGGVRTPAARFQRWGTTRGERPEDGTWEQVTHDFCALTDPAMLVEWAQDYVLHLADKGTRSLTRFIPRWTQAEAAPLMVHRALDPDRRRGLLSHFQGSGKTFSCLMAANAITRIDPGHCVVLVVDRLDLLTQHKGDFESSDARRSVHEAATVADLNRLLGNANTSGIIITTVQRFSDVGLITSRSDITCLVDEAHRSQEGDFGRYMRTAIPNATLLGLTGTPITDRDRNTYETFGDPDDTGHVLHLYTAADSVRDGTTVPLVIDRRHIVQHVDKAALDADYDTYTEGEGLSLADKERLARRATATVELLKDPKRIRRIDDDIAAHMQRSVLRDGYGAMVVVADREACVLHTAELRARLGEDVVTAVISGSKDDPEEYEEFILDSAAEERIKSQFRDPDEPLKLLVVTSKLLTGFDAKNCLVSYIDKPMRGHTLFQAATRVNRTWTTPAGAEKGYGIVVDYCGIADKLQDAYSQSADGASRRELATPNELAARFVKSLKAAEANLGDDFDWDSPSFMSNAKTKLRRNPSLWRAYRQNVNRADLMYEIISDHDLAQANRTRFRRLLRILHAASDTTEATHERTLLDAHGAAVRDLLQKHTGDAREVVMRPIRLDGDAIEELIGELGDPSTVVTVLQTEEVLEQIRDRLRARMTGAHADAYQSIAAKLEAFAAATYYDTEEDARRAILDLVSIAEEIKVVDDAVGDQWDDLEVELYGTRRKPAPDAVLNEPASALQQILTEYQPDNVPVSTEQVAEVLADIVERLAYRQLRDNTATQKNLRKSLTRECKRIGVLPPKRAEATAFIDALVEYINIWLL